MFGKNFFEYTNPNILKIFSYIEIYFSIFLQIKTIVYVPIVYRCLTVKPCFMEGNSMVSHANKSWEGMKELCHTLSVLRMQLINACGCTCRKYIGINAISNPIVINVPLLLKVPSDGCVHRNNDQGNKGIWWGTYRHRNVPQSYTQGSIPS